ncbi:N-acetyltransferase family protein [Lysobacter xanthus]
MDVATIRRARPEDAARLSGLMRRLFLEAYGDCSTPGNVVACMDAAFSPARQAVELADPHRACWVAEAGDHWLGYAQGRFDPPPAEGCAFVRPAQLHRLYLAREAQGSGLGARLLATVRDEARRRGADGLWLSVWQRAPGPISFYQRLGFRIVGRAVFEVGDDPLEDWIMAAPIDAAVDA